MHFWFWHHPSVVPTVCRQEYKNGRSSICSFNKNPELSNDLHHLESTACSFTYTTDKVGWKKTSFTFHNNLSFLRVSSLYFFSILLDHMYHNSSCCWSLPFFSRPTSIDMHKKIKELQCAKLQVSVPRRLLSLSHLQGRYKTGSDTHTGSEMAQQTERRLGTILLLQSHLHLMNPPGAFCRRKIPIQLL